MLALVTAAAAAGLDPDLAPIRDAFRGLAVEVEVVDWDDESVDWSRFEAVFLRSTWDYVDRLGEFTAWLDRVGSQTKIVNDRHAIDWNIDKHYLAELAAAGVPIVPTVFVDPGESVPMLDADQRVWVVKPAVGAGSNGAKRCRPDEVASHVETLHATGVSAMVQPYLDRIDDEAETSLVFVSDGGPLQFDHAFSKAAILIAAEVEQDGDLFAKEEIGPRDASTEQLELAAAVVASAPVVALGRLAYARIDVVPTDDGPVLMELELIEPSVYVQTSPGSADRIAAAWQRFLS